jgi:hypothetical protein
MKIKKQADFKNLEIVHIFEYYDIPLFFISESSDNEFYINYYIDEMTNGVDKWFFGRISNKERLKLLNKQMSVLSFLNHLLKKERLYHIFIDPFFRDLGAELKLELVNAKNLDEESFPEEDFYVEYDYVTGENLIKLEEDIMDSSRFKVILKDKNNSHDISLDFFINLFEKFKSAMVSAAKDIEENLMGEISTSTVNLKLDSLEPSSFGVWVKAESNDIFETSDKSLNNIFNIIENVSLKSKREVEELIEIDQEYSLETIKNIKNMLYSISKNEFSFNLRGTSKFNGVRREVTFNHDSYEGLNILLDILEDKSEKTTENIEVEGTLISVNVSRNYFKIQTLEADIKGKMSMELFEKSKKLGDIQFRVPSGIKAEIQKEIIKDYVNDDSSIKYTLLSFEQPK